MNTLNIHLDTKTLNPRLTSISQSLCTKMSFNSKKLDDIKFVQEVHMEFIKIYLAGQLQILKIIQMTMMENMIRYVIFINFN